ncbi:hypothetical protein CHLNCDRAFT_140518 [Chlorella variabilis]|uniref:Uncharacterized protein n=1 Tax=Chlorella variabilis TaxID=554065 RepID=E1Z5K4_CHLVA|nr:hypothetical protein CHLNCDRAFT_140518 [Chlorella variabilis]EFN58489.1 hypothetical protein CHLNCDRAFT_140518 [Chlorella variabilis]|eukprot:XP_005850591.1 hypothetical protein CHLNCDRAFT_140518 [Chlorella variabilis]
MLQACAARPLLQASALRALSCCAAAAEELAAAKPGTVSGPYDQHILLQLPRPVDAVRAPGVPGAWWPQLVEREPAVVEAFREVARRGDVIGKVKITAFEEVARRDEGPPPGACNLLAFPAGLQFDGLPVEQVGLAVALATADEPNKLPMRASDRRALTACMAATHDLSLFVCCHAARDARCGQLGPPLAASLHRLVRARGLEEHVAVYATSHIGGHKYAGNVVCYGAVHPCDGDWFGGVNAGNAESFLDALLAVELGVDGGAEHAALRPFWRGRMGLSKEEQRELWEQGGGIEELEGSGDEEEEIDEELEQLLAERRRGLL